jgi:RNA 3'-terminal phosphate cyclase
MRLSDAVLSSLSCLQDQIIIFMALAEGESTIRTGPLTLHTK